MTFVCLVRSGFSKRLIRLPEGTEALHYSLEEPFAPSWNSAVATGAEFILLVDDAIDFRPGDLTLLLRILQTSPSVDGITMDSAALIAVYGMEAQHRRAAQFRFTLTELPALPSWFALLRTKRWSDTNVALTPEFFLLSQDSPRRVFRTGAPVVELDPVLWAGDLILASSELMAKNWEHVKNTPAASSVPAQFRVQIPGSVRSDNRHQAGEDFPWQQPRPVFSILCPSIRPDFLRESVRSVLTQTYPFWELRIGIDGPVENNLRKIEVLLSEFASESRIHVEYHEHLGTGPTRKRLCDGATGDYLIGMDDDDRLPPHALERIAQAIEKDPSLPLLRGGVQTFGLFDIYLPPKPRYMVGGIPNDIFEVNQPYVVRRDVMDLLGGYEWDDQLKSAGEDSDLFLKADRTGLPVLLIDEPLYERRLSTMNQTLDCSAEECIQHVRNLYNRHTLPGWSLNGIDFRDDGALLVMTTVHRSDVHLGQVTCATRFMDFQKVGSRKEVVLDLELSSLCNAVCTFCPREHMQREARFITLDTVESIAASLRQEEGQPHVVLCGIAESTLHPDLDRIIQTLAGSGASVGMTTNGWNLSPEMVDILVAAGLTQLNVSLNAFSSATHAHLMHLQGFDRIVSACAEVASLRSQRWPKLEFNVSFVVTASNAAEAVPFAQHWRDSGVSQVWLHPMTNRTGLVDRKCEPAPMDSLGALYATDQKVQVDLFPDQNGPANLCRVARGVDFISVDGDMLLCAQDYQARHKFGNVNQTSLAQLHHAKLLQHLRGETSDTCSGCTFCPPSFRAGRTGLVSIVQSGGV